MWRVAFVFRSWSLLFYGRRNQLKLDFKLENSTLKSNMAASHAGNGDTPNDNLFNSTFISLCHVNKREKLCDAISLYGSNGV